MCPQLQEGEVTSVPELYPWPLPTPNAPGGPEGEPCLPSHPSPQALVLLFLGPIIRPGAQEGTSLAKVPSGELVTVPLQKALNPDCHS